MKEQIKPKKFRKLLAILTLGIGGAILGTATTVPFMLKNWRTIQFDVIELKQDYSLSTDTSVGFVFDFSDEDSYKLNYQDINVSLLDEKDQVIHTGIAKYSQLFKEWQFNKDNQKLKAGKKYIVKLETTQNSIGKQKKIVKFSDGVRNYVETKANVESFDYPKAANATTQPVVVTFADDVKSLEGKKAILKYYYTNIDPDNKEIKNDQSKVPASQSVEIKDNKANFLLEGLQSSRQYVIESVMYLDESETNGIQKQKEISIPVAKEAIQNVNYKFKTNEVKLQVHSIERVNFKEFSGTLIVGFLKSNNEPDVSLNGKSITLEYRKVGTEEILKLESFVKNSSAIFEFDKIKNPLDDGSDYEIIALKDEGLEVAFSSNFDNNENNNPNYSKRFKTKSAISKVEFNNIKSKEAEINLTIKVPEFNPNDSETFNYQNADVEITLEPSSNGVLKRAKLVEKSKGIYNANFKVTGLEPGYNYSLERVKVFLENGSPEGQIIKYGKFKNLENNLDIEFTTKTRDIDIVIKGETKIDFRNEEKKEQEKVKNIKVETDKAEVLIGFDPEFSFLNNKKLILTYKQINPVLIEEKIIRTEMQPNGNSGTFILTKLEPGTTYQLLDVEVKDDSTIELNLLGTENNSQSVEDKQFTTLSRVADFSYSGIEDTEVNVNIRIADATGTLFKDHENQPIEKREGRIIYQAIKDEVAIESPKTSQWSEVNKETKTLSFNLSELSRGTKYQIINLELKPGLSTFYNKNVSSAPGNTFKTTAKSVEIQKLSPVGKGTTSTSADYKLLFDVSKNPFLVKKTIKVYYEDKNGEKDPVNSEIDPVGNALINIQNLEEGSKFKFSKVELVDLETKVIWPKDNKITEEDKTFYTKASVIDILNSEFTDNSSKLLITFKNKDPRFKFLNKTLKINYTSPIGISSSTKTTISKFRENNQYEIEIENLDKFSTFTIDEIYLDDDLIEKSSNLDSNSNKFKTSAKSAKIVSFNQLSNTINSVDFQLDFNPEKDIFMDGKKVKVTLREKINEDQDPQNAHILSQIRKVSNSSLLFNFTDLKEGTSYGISSIEYLDENEQVSNETSITFDETTVSENDRFVYTKPLISGFEFSKITESTAVAKIIFSDSKGYFLDKKLKFDLLNEVDNNSATIEDDSLVVTDKGYSKTLTNLNKFTTYKIIGVFVEITKGNWERVEYKNTINKENSLENEKSFFKTTINNVNVRKIEVYDITKNSAKIKYYFSEEDWFVKDRPTTLKYQLNSAIADIVPTHSKQIKNELGDLVVEFELQDLEEGTTYKAANIEIENVDTIGNDEQIFKTLAVVEKIKELDNKTETSASVEITFKNDDDELNGKEATVRFTSESNGTLKSAVARIVDNKAKFDLSSLEKTTKYIYQDVSINLSGNNLELDLSKNYNQNPNENERILDFTTPSETAKVVAFVKSGATSSSIDLTFNFDKVKDTFMVRKNVSITYRNRNTREEITEPTKAIVNDDNILTFHLNKLDQGGTYEVLSLNLDGIAISFDNSIVDKTFAALPTVSFIDKTVASTDESDTQMGLTVFFEDGLQTLVGKKANITLVSNTGEQKIFSSSAIELEQGQNPSSRTKTIFRLDHLSKNTTYTIEEISIDGQILDFNNIISDKTHEKRFFKTTAKKAYPTLIKQTDSTESTMDVLITFDVNVDPYLIGKDFKLTFKKENEQALPSEIVTMNDRGELNFGLSNTEIRPGSLYVIQSLEVVNAPDLTTIIELNNQNQANAILNKNISTNSTISRIEKQTINENDATIIITLNSQDTSLTTKKAWISLVDESTQIITEYESPANIGNDYRITFNPTGLTKNVNYTILGVKTGNKKSPLLNFENGQSGVPEADKKFKTQPKTATIIESSFKFLDEAKTRAAVTLRFDENVDAFINGKALKLKYKKTYPTAGVGSQEIVISKFNSQNIVVKGSTIQFILQGKIDENGNQVNDNGEIKFYFDNNQIKNDTYNLKGLVKGSVYTIQSLELTEPQANETLVINFKNDVVKTLTTPMAVIDYYVDPSIPDVEDGSSVTLSAYIMSAEPITNADLAKYKVKFANKSTGKFEILNATNIEDKTINPYTVYKINFQGLLQKQSRYEIFSVVKIENNEEFKLHKYEKGYYNNVGASEILVEAFSTSGTIATSTINSIETGDFTTTNAKVSIGFVAANENLLRVNRNIQVKYKKVGSNNVVELPGPHAGKHRIDPITKKLELNFINLDEGSEYEITEIKILGHTGQSINSPEHNATIKTGISKKFKTNSVIQSFTFTNVEQKSADLTLVLKDQANSLNNKRAFITIAKTSDLNDTYSFASTDVAANDSTNANNKTFTFNAIGLEKDVEYQFLSVVVDGEQYEKSTTFTGNNFRTTATDATITKIDYTNITKNSVEFNVQFSAIDDFMNTRQIKVFYTTNGGNEVEGGPVSINDQGNATFSINNLIEGTTYTISRFEDQNTTNRSTINIDTSVEKSFSTNHVIESIATTPGEQNVDITIVFKEDKAIRLKSKLITLKLQNIDKNFLGTVFEDTNDSNKLKVKFEIDNLDKKTDYTIENIKLNGEEFEFINGFNDATKTFTTLASDVTINRIETISTTTDSAEIKLILHQRDKFLDGQNVKLVFKEVNSTNQNSNEIKSELLEVSLDNGNPIVTFNLDNTKVSNGKKYEIVKIEPDPSGNLVWDSHLSSFISVSNPKSKFFETKISQPTISNISLIETTNTEQEENTFMSKVELEFNDPNDALNTNLINDWDIKISNENNDSKTDQNLQDNDYLSKVQIVNRSISRSGDITKLTFFIRGNVRNWVGVQNKLKIKFSYFDDLQKTNSLETTNYITTKADNNELIFQTQEKVYVDKLSGVIYTGEQLRWYIELYDPTDSIKTLTTINNTSNLTDNEFNFKVKGKKSILNFRGQGWDYSRPSTRALAKWENNEVIGNETLTDEQKRALNGQDITPSYLTGMKFKYSLQNSQWIDYEPYLRTDKRIPAYETSIDGDTKRKRLTFRIESIKTNKYISQLFYTPLDEMRLKNSKMLFATKNPKISEILHSMTITGTGHNWYGSNALLGDKWNLGVTATIDESTQKETVVGLIRAEYNEDNGKFKAVIATPNTPSTDASGKLWGHNSDTFAMFMNEQGDLYFFGGKDGRPIPSIQSFTYNANKTEAYLEFDLKADIIPIDQRPKHNEKLKFVGLIGTGINHKNANTLFNYMYAWRDLTDAYKEITYKE